MGYRRSRADAANASKWKKFKSTNMMLFANTKIPDVLLEQRRLFDYLLMHGDWDTYYVADLSPDQFGDFEELVARYLAEFDDPGLMLPGGWKTHERIWARVQTLKATSA